MSDSNQKRRALKLLRQYTDAELEIVAGPAGVDLRGQLEGQVVSVQLKSMNRGTIEDMKGRLAMGVLQAPKEFYGGETGKPVVILHAPRIGRRAIGELQEFMRQYAPEFGWGAFDERDSFHFEMPGLDIEIDERGRSSTEEARKTKYNKRAFTDLNRWLLKILMLRDAPEGMWKSGENYRSEVRNPNELKDIADVSQAKAYQFARTFRELGFLKWSREEFRIRDRRHLFELWYEEERQLHVEEHPARSIFGSTDLDEFLWKAEDEVTYAVGGFAACELHGVLHTKVGVPKIHIAGDRGNVMDKLDLEPVAEHQAEVCLVDLPYSESIFRGAVTIDGIRVVDILQAALDSGRSRGRGREQAEYIIDHVLEWGRKWS